MSDQTQPENTQSDSHKVIAGTVQVFKKLASAIKKQPADDQAKTHKAQNPLVKINYTPEQTAEMKANIRKLWGQTLIPGTLPGATIKISSLAPCPSLPTYIPQRQFAHPKEKKAAHSDYKVLEKIADGGMGSVFIGEQSSLKRRVAIKTIKEDAINDKEGSAQFLAEALVTGELDHPNIVPIYELGTNGDGLYFYAMKHVRGISWDECIQHKSQDENLDILTKVCDAVAFAHSRGIIHRDLKPENIMIGQFGEVLLMDWGLAGTTKPDDQSGLFGSGNTLGGTPAYMAPECARGDNHKIGTATDIYLIGALLFEIICGKPPHDKEKAEDSLEAAAKNEIPALSTQSELLTIALHAMQTEPEDRYGSVLELQENIRDYRKHEESLTLTSDAENYYTRARVNESYGEFSAGMHACFEALRLWPENEIARKLRDSIRIDYARLSMKREDYDLSLTLLREKDKGDRDLIRKAKRLRDERSRRLQLQNRLKYALSITVIITLLIMAGAYTVVSKKRAQTIYDNFVIQTRLAEQLLHTGNWLEVQKISRSIPAYLRGWEWDWIDQASRVSLTPDTRLPQAPLRVITSADATHRALIFGAGQLQIQTLSGSASFSVPDEIHDFHWTQNAGMTQAYCLHGNTISMLTPDSGTSWQIQPLKTQLPEKTAIISTSGRLYLVQNSPDDCSVYETASGQLVSQLQLTPENQMMHFVFSKNEHLLAGIDVYDNRLKTYDTRTGKRVERSAPHAEYTTGKYTQMEFFQDDSLLMVLGKGDVVYVCNVRHMNPRTTIPLQSQPTCVAISPNGNQILTCTAEGETLLFHIPSSTITWHVRQQRHTVKALAATQTGTDWLLYDAIGQVLPFSESERNTSLELFQNDVPVLQILWSELTNTLITKDQLNRYLQSDVESGERHLFSLQARIRSPHHVITINGEDHLALMHRENGLLLFNLHSHEHKEFSRFQQYQAMAPYGNTLLLASEQRLVRFDPLTGSDLEEWELNLGPLRTMAVLQKNQLWIAGQDNRLHSMNLITGKQILLESPAAKVIRWVPDPAGNFIVAHTASRDAFIYHPHQRKIQATLSGATHVITGLVLSPDAERLIGSSADGKVRIWDTATWREIVNFRAHIGTATQTGIHPDGTFVFTAGTDGAVRLWNGKAHHPVATSNP